jgi:hypothetical protein
MAALLGRCVRGRRGRKKRSTPQPNRERYTDAGPELGAKPVYVVLHLPNAPSAVTGFRSWFRMDDGTGKQTHWPVVTNLVPLAR